MTGPAREVPETGRSPAGASGDVQERVVGGLRIRIDRTLCVGFADCIGEAPEAFALGEDGVVAFVEPEKVERERLTSACDLCPVDALTVWDETGAQIVPS